MAQRSKEFPVSKNPYFNYSEFCLQGFKKTFPILCEADPETVALRLYEDASAFSGRDGRSNGGGGESDVMCLCAAAAAVELPVCAARQIKDALRARLHEAWLTNNHAFIFKAAFSFERSASMAVIDLREVAWADPYRRSDEDEEESVEIPEEVEEWIEVVCEPSQARSVIGNSSRNRLRRKTASRAVKSLFGEAE